MVSTGMKDAGYQYVNIDDCWSIESAATRERHAAARSDALPERHQAASPTTFTAWD